MPRPLTANLRTIVVLEPGRVLHPHDLFSSTDESFDSPSADVVQHPTSGATAIRNLSEHPWRLLRDGVAEASIARGMAVVIRDGVSIDFGNAIGRLSGPTTSG